MSEPIKFSGAAALNKQAQEIKKLQLDLGALTPALDLELRAVVREGAAIIAAEAAVLAPRRSGKLASRYRPFALHGRDYGVKAGVRNTLPYANVIEYGGTIRPRGVPIVFQPRAPLGTAVERDADAVLEAVTKAFDRIVRRQGWR